MACSRGYARNSGHALDEEGVIMQLWVAMGLCVTCIIGAVGAFLTKRKRKKGRYLAGGIALLLLAIGFLAYAMLTWILVDSNRDSIKERASDFIDPIIEEAIILLNASPSNQQSMIVYPYEQKMEYDNLDEKEKTMYNDMLKKVRAFEPISYTAKEDGYEIMDQAMQIYGAITSDYSEVENYFYLEELFEGDMTSEIRAGYFMPDDPTMKTAIIDELKTETHMFERVCERIVEKMPKQLSAYDQYRYLAIVISCITSYDYEGEYGWQVATAYGATVSGHSICQGYALGFRYLCKVANLWCEFVEGESEGVAHGWNLVKLETGTYHIDITWADELGVPGGEEWNRYFMLTQEEIVFDHEVYDTIATGTLIR